MLLDDLLRSAPIFAMPNYGRGETNVTAAEEDEVHADGCHATCSASLNAQLADKSPDTHIIMGLHVTKSQDHIANE